MIRIPFWKKWWSYISDVHLESHESSINPVLHLVLAEGRLQLCTENSIYSFEDKYDNYYKAFELLYQNDKWNYSNILILGFGLGSIPKMLETNFKLNLNYTAVEIDDVIIDMVSDYVLPHLTSSIQMINADALRFMELNEETYDMICIDLFLDDIIPDQFKAKSFLQSAKQALSTDGIVLYNMLGDYEKDRKITKVFFREQFKKVFPDASMIHTGTNFILASSAVFSS
jgi:spermidine synthase